MLRLKKSLPVPGSRHRTSRSFAHGDVFGNYKLLIERTYREGCGNIEGRAYRENERACRIRKALEQRKYA